MTKRVEVVGMAVFSSLPSDLQWDVSLGIQTALRRTYAHLLPNGYDFGTGGILAALDFDNPEIDLVMVDPKRLKACGRMTGAVHAGLVRKYEKLFRRGDQFPPIVVNSSARKMLVEGAHRACSAERAGIPKIEALDVASVDLEAVLRHGDRLLFRR